MMHFIVYSIVIFICVYGVINRICECIESCSVNKAISTIDEDTLTNLFGRGGKK